MVPIRIGLGLSLACLALAAVLLATSLRSDSPRTELLDAKNVKTQEAKELHHISKCVTSSIQRQHIASLLSRLNRSGKSVAPPNFDQFPTYCRLVDWTDEPEDVEDGDLYKSPAKHAVLGSVKSSTLFADGMKMAQRQEAEFQQEVAKGKKLLTDFMLLLEGAQSLTDSLDVCLQRKLNRSCQIWRP